MNMRLTVVLMIAVMVFAAASISFAGTGGAELQSIWNDIVGMLQGTLGKIIAIFLVGFSIKAAFGGAVLPAIMFFVMGLAIGMLPSIINTRFTLIF